MVVMKNERRGPAIVNGASPRPAGDVSVARGTGYRDDEEPGLLTRPI